MPAQELAFAGLLSASSTGVEFIDENGGGPGVCLKQSTKPKGRKQVMSAVSRDEAKLSRANKGRRYATQAKPKPANGSTIAGH